MRVLASSPELLEALDRAVAADPVRATVLGTVAAMIRTEGSDAWAAVAADGIAVRAAPEYPVAVVGSWTAERAGLLAALRDLPTLAGIGGPVAVVDELAAALGRTGHRMAERLFRLDSLRPPADVPGSARVATPADRDLLVDWYVAFAAEALDGLPREHLVASVERVLDGQGAAWVWDTTTGEPASMAVRRAVIAGSARVGPVYTPPAARGHGYGSAATAAASAEVLSLGAVPVLFTDQANPVSNSIYQRLGYHPVEDHLRITFG